MKQHQAKQNIQVVIFQKLRSVHFLYEKKKSGI